MTILRPSSQWSTSVFFSQFKRHQQRMCIHWQVVISCDGVPFLKVAAGFKCLCHEGNHFQPASASTDSCSIITTFINLHCVPSSHFLDDMFSHLSRNVFIYLIYFSQKRLINATKGLKSVNNLPAKKVLQQHFGSRKFKKIFVCEPSLNLRYCSANTCFISLFNASHYQNHLDVLK